MTEKQTYDFVAIGDIVIDAFIKLQDASVHCKLDDTACELCVRYGDKIPFESATVIPAVGNSANAAVSAARLGLRSALIANIGNDANGQSCIDALVKNNVATEFIKKHATFPTNYHYVLWYDVDRTILVKHAPFPYALPDMNPPKWIYLSSMGKDSLSYHDEIATYLEKNSEVKLAFQPGTFQMELGTARLSRIYSRTEIFFCNKEEAMRILETKETDVKTLAQKIKSLGPSYVCITDGKNGAYAFDGDTLWYHSIYPDPKPPVERTGAGDAYASTVVSALALGLPIQEALNWGPINSMSVVQYVGAQEGLLNRESLETYLKNAPNDYSSKIL